jgi:hypothetical protein
MSAGSSLSGDKAAGTPGPHTHLRLLPKLRMTAAVPPVPQYAFMAWRRITLRDTKLIFHLHPLPRLRRHVGELHFLLCIYGVVVKSIGNFTFVLFCLLADGMSVAGITQRIGGTKQPRNHISRKQSWTVSVYRHILVHAWKTQKSVVFVFGAHAKRRAAVCRIYARYLPSFP